MTLLTAGRRGGKRGATLEMFLDTDFGVAGLQAQAWFDAAYAAGYRGFVTTLHTFWDGTPAVWTDAQTALSRARTAGMWVAAYWRNVEYWGAALDACTAENLAALRFVICDVEPETGGPFPVTANIITATEAYGPPAVVYSYSAAWASEMAGTTNFSDEVLFDRSIRDFIPRRLTDSAPTAYGGWNTGSNYRTLWQCGEVTQGGIAISRDFVLKSWLATTSTRTVNLCSKGSHGTFENATTGWSALSSTISKSTEQAQSGLSSLKVVTDNAGATEGAIANITGISAETEYTYSFWYYGPSTTIRIAWDENDSGVSYLRTRSTTATPDANTWTKITLTAATGEDAASINIYFNPTVQGSYTFYVDNVRVESA